MKTLFLILFACSLFTSCDKRLADDSKADVASETETVVSINGIEVLKKELVLNQIEGKWYYKNEPFSGYAVTYYTNDTLAEKLGFVNGKRESVARQWSENGVLRIESYYKQNRLNAVYKSWWENGVLSAQSNYIDGVKQGIEKEWYASGQLAKERQLVDGQETGMQQAWLPNGTLYINYEAKNGRIFGLQRANSCYKLEDEKVIRNQTL
jgi:antitoxin component YwqK of YwqJK toxin-antitoxin module